MATKSGTGTTSASGADEHLVTLTALDAVLESVKQARRALRQTETAYRQFRRRIEKRSSISQAFSGLGIPERRREINVGLDALEHSRHEARRAIIAQGLSEGLSLGQLARLWGVSRQLITRMAKERG
jgi:hypothetical protein